MAVFANVTDVTDAMIDEARAMIGVPLRIDQYNREASLDTIRHYAHGIGDDNPLWCDEDYANVSPYGGMVAPPTFFVSVFPQGIAPRMAGLQPFHAGTGWRWQRLARRGEAIHASAKLVDVRPLTGRTGGRMVLQVGEARYETADGELLAQAETRIMRVPRPGAASGGLHYEPKPERQYSQEELDHIERGVFAEQVRGSRPRWWSDVQVGEELTPVVKGPLDRIAMTTYYAGAPGTEGYKSCELRWRQWYGARNRPETVPNNHDITYLSEFVLPSLGHQDNGVAHAVGMPGAYDNGPMRTAWMSHLVTNWMGDAAFLRSLDVRIEKPNQLGNTMWCRGTVVRKFADQGYAAVELDLYGEDIDGIRNASGKAVVWLPDEDHSDPLVPADLSNALDRPSEGDA